MPKKQSPADVGVPANSQKKGDNRPIVRRRPTGGGRAKLDRHGHLMPGDATGK